MPAYFTIQGSVQVEDNATTQEICSGLMLRYEGISFQTVDVGGDDGKSSHTVLFLEINDGWEMSYVGIEQFINRLSRLSPFAIEVGVFETDTDGNKDTIWIGKPEEVAAAKLEDKINTAREALDDLPDDERKKLIVSYLCQ